MIKNALTFLLIFSASLINAQTPNTKSSESQDERFPVFANCKNLEHQDLEKCFYNEVQQFVYQNFQIPEGLKQNQYKLFS